MEFIGTLEVEYRPKVALKIGSQLGSYEVLSLLGRGGMGEVYRAHDTRLNRDVAIKVLPNEFADNPDRLSRFKREAQLLASLNHPNVAQIYGLEESKDTRCIVMELVEGETLEQRLQRGPVPIEEALTIAEQIAEALESAHEKGIIHRDLKPANVKVVANEKVKVLDFGLAKAFNGESTTTDMSNSPTMLSVSMPGLILGTAAYMSPEQARGKAVDKRADLWAFGCVLYEMIAGRPAFSGETVTDILGAVVKTEPDWSTLPQATPSVIAMMLRRCLQKDRNRRMGAAREVTLEIEQVLAQPLTDAGSTINRTKRVWCLAAAIAVITFGLGAILGTLYFRRAPLETPEMRLQVETPPTADPMSIALSPDGRRLAFVASPNGQRQLWIRSLDSLAAQALPGTDDASFPFWSPDNRYIGFFADGKLKKIGIAGEPAQTLADVRNGFGGAWSHDGIILFAPRIGGTVIYRVPFEGGSTTAVTQLEQGETGHLFPQFLPDGKHFLYFVRGTREVRGIYAGSLDGSIFKRLLPADSRGTYVSPGFLIFARQGTLLAQRFDVRKLEIDGSPFPIADKVAFDGNWFTGAISASANGLIVYRSGEGNIQHRLSWFDRSGKEIGTVGEPDPDSPNSPELSPDGKSVALYRDFDGLGDIYVLDTTRGVPNRFTVNPASDNLPIWSPNGDRIVFGSNRTGPYLLYSKASNGAGVEEKLWDSPKSNLPLDWSFDGRFILYGVTVSPSNSDIQAMPLFGERKPIEVANTRFSEWEGQFSPDVRWVAYKSDKSGRSEVYVQAFQRSGREEQISTNGGSQPRWRRDGKELFYIAPDKKLMSVPISVSSDGDKLELGTPTALFRSRIFSGPKATAGKTQYAVSADGQSFLMVVEPEDPPASPITIILNWAVPSGAKK